MDNTPNETGLDSYLDTLWSQASENRSKTEEKWNRNRAAREADADLDPKGTWKRKERKSKWKSDTFFDITRQKCMTFMSLVTDQMTLSLNASWMTSEPMADVGHTPTSRT